jgi:hypothetical protein
VRVCYNLAIHAGQDDILFAFEYSLRSRAQIARVSAGMMKRRAVMNRVPAWVGLVADLIGIGTFLVAILPNLPWLSESAYRFASSLPLSQRLLLALGLDLGIAYLLGSIARLLARSDSVLIPRSPRSFPLFLGASGVLAFTSIYNFARIIFLDRFLTVWPYLALFGLLFLSLVLRQLLLRLHLTQVRQSSAELVGVQRIVAITYLLLFAFFIFERAA